MRHWISLCFLVLIFPRIGPAETSKDLVELLPAASINWTIGVVEARGLFPMSDPSAQEPAMQKDLHQAQLAAAENILLALKQMRMDTTRDVEVIMALNPEIGARVTQLAQNAHIIQKEVLSDGMLKVTLRIDLLGGLSQLILPEEIKQVEPIKPLQREFRAKDPDSEQVVESGFSGLIVDARGIGARPAIVPLLVDENGKQIFGPAFVSREYAVQYGMCGYVRSLDSSNRQARVGLNPLMVKGLRTLQEGTCDIVISNADAARLRDASANLGFLKQCRVMIVLD
jgi:hypothetical protein